MLTFDRNTVDSAGVFLVGELERLDQSLHQPLASVTWSRDIQLREDVSMADEFSSFTNSTFAAAGGPSPNGKSWIGKDATAIQALQLDIGKTAQPLTLWGMQLGWTIPELMSAQRIGRPVDQQKFSGMQLKHNMDVDEQVYIGDASLGLSGLANHVAVTPVNVANGNWTSGTPTVNQILSDVNDLLNSAWEASGYAICPSELRLPPNQYAYLAQELVSSAGSQSILSYLEQNSISLRINGRPLNIQPLKWLAGRGVSGTNRMIAYTNDQTFVRFPMVPLQRTPLEYRDLRQLTTYFGRLGEVEMVYPETVAYGDGI